MASIAQLTNATICDKLGSINAQISDLESLKKEYSAELVRRGVIEAQGDLFRAVVSPASVRWTLDRPAIVDAMGEPWAVKHSKPSNVAPVVRIYARTRPAIAA